MKVKELQKYLAACDPDNIILIAGFETVSTMLVAEPDLVIQCKSVPYKEDAMSGNRCVCSNGDSSVWIGWNNDYRTEHFLDHFAAPEE
ncbi:hypothetical protein [Pectobacterium versatile]|uniref:hypothetical protein n=1 Tax=Pectobacterium versatile TaxID=2488639 RepID=UPI0015DE515D|nr:hypothetical protein [Pectobacterium versatile]MBA0170455.1 hypothetical protein [Pectobacterium versatile]